MQEGEHKIPDGEVCKWSKRESTAEKPDMAKKRGAEELGLRYHQHGEVCQAVGKDRIPLMGGARIAAGSVKGK